jgi:peroxiredoxin
MPALPPGSAAPNFTLKDANGNSHSLAAALTNGPALLVFFKVSCPTCQYGMRYFSRIGEHLADTPVTVWAVSQNDPSSTKTFNREFESKLPTLIDSEDAGFVVSNAYGITNVPTAFVMGPDGEVKQTSVGWVKAEVEEIAAAMSAAADHPPFIPFKPGEDILAYKGG